MPAGALNIADRSGDELKQDILDIFTNVASLSKSCCVSNSKRNLNEQRLSEGYQNSVGPSSKMLDFLISQHHPLTLIHHCRNTAIVVYTAIDTSS